MGDFDEDESLEDTLVRLATEYNRKKSRKERKEQRAVFRDIHSTVTDGDQASMSVNLGGMQVTFSGWCPRIQLNALRSCLSSGFQTHLQHNTTVREILNLGKFVQGGHQDRLSSVEKRLYRSKNSMESKQRTQKRAAARDKRRNVANDFLLN